MVKNRMVGALARVKKEQAEVAELGRLATTHLQPLFSLPPSFCLSSSSELCDM